MDDTEMTGADTEANEPAISKKFATGKFTEELLDLTGALIGDVASLRSSRKIKR
jgi:hypothetical protein